MAAMAESRMNLSALQQRDPYITGIVDTASQVALYSFNPQTNEWEKTDVEGTLFVYTRSASPVNGFLILNRLGLNDLTEPINKNLEFQLQDPFLLYRNGSAAIYGIWFYDKDECARIGQLMNSLVQIAIDTIEKKKEENARRERRASESEIKVEQRVSHSEQKVKVMVEQDHVMLSGSGAVGGNRNLSIMDMLSKARDEYEKGEQRHSPAVAVASQEGAGSAQASQHIMEILARAKAESEKVSKEGSAQVKPAAAAHGYHSSRDSPKSKERGKAARKHAPKPMIDNPNASATKATNILRPLALKPNSSTGDLEDTTTTPSTSITLDALFKSTQEDKKVENESVSPIPVMGMGMPPLLQRIMSQPGSSMLEDIERQPYPCASGAEASNQQSASNGASVPKMPSPPKTVNAKWSHPEPDSPNTVIKRSLNMIVDRDTVSDSKHLAQEKPRKPNLSRTASVPVESKSASFWPQNVQSAAVGTSQMSRKSPQVPGQSSHISPQNGTTAPATTQQTPSDSVTARLEEMAISNEKLQQGLSEQITSPGFRTDSQLKREARPDLKLNTGAIVEESQPELVTPQALLEKAPFPVFSKSTPYSSSQVASDSSASSSVLLTPMAFENTSNVSRATPPLNPVQLADSFLMQRNSISGEAVSHSSPGSQGTQDKPREEDPTVNALTKQQLQQALIYLLKNDSNFLTAIHEGYVQSLNQELRAKAERL